MSHIPIITRNDTIDEWRIQTNLTANAMNRLESGNFEKTDGDLLLSGDSTLTITSSANPAVSVSNNVLISGTTKSTTYQETRAIVSTTVIDLSTANYFTKTISSNTTFSVANVPSSGTVASFILDLTDGGSNSVYWWAGVQWPNGVQPVLTISGRDVLGFFTHDGGTIWTGFMLGRDVKANT
jgi:hypothetical protein